jgi:hypothetical protein
VTVDGLLAPWQTTPTAIFQRDHRTTSWISDSLAEGATIAGTIRDSRRSIWHGTMALPSPSSGDTWMRTEPPSCDQQSRLDSFIDCNCESNGSLIFGR